MLMFAAFFGVAIWYRKKPRVHRPAMVVAAFRQTRSVHPVYLIGLAVCVIRIFNVPVIASTGAWGSVAHWVFGLMI
jgi:hypothetical protein